MKGKPTAMFRGHTAGMTGLGNNFNHRSGQLLLSGFTLRLDGLRIPAGDTTASKTAVGRFIV